MSVTELRNDESGYLDWISRNPRGFVVNGRRRFDPGYLVLHRASCTTVRRYPTMDQDPGGFTERGYVKICSTSIRELEKYLAPKAHRRRAFSKECRLCEPR